MIFIVLYTNITLHAPAYNNHLKHLSFKSFMNLWVDIQLYFSFNDEIQKCVAKFIQIWIYITAISIFCSIKAFRQSESAVTLTFKCSGWKTLRKNVRDNLVSNKGCVIQAVRWLIICHLCSR